MFLLGLFWDKCSPVLTYPLSSSWNAILYYLESKRSSSSPSSFSLLRYHSAFWDEHQWLPLIGLDEHILLLAERHLVMGEAAVDALSTTRQRWAAIAAQIELDARQLDRCDTPQDIAQIHQSLTITDLGGPANPLFRSFNRHSEDTAAALNQTSPYNQRLALTAVGDRLDGLIRELTRSSDKYAVRFRPIAQRWSRIIALHIQDLTQAAEQRQEIDSPYIIGVPLTERQEIFVGRTDISARIEQLLLDRRRPPLLLYGQRRTGKTSLLHNLGRLLPGSVVPLFIDLQGPASSASDHAGLLYNLARSMSTAAQRQRNIALPSLPRDALTADPFTSFDEWLDAVEATLQESTALLAFDEFEVLDQAFTKGRFDETQVLGMLRNLIQHRPRFKVLLAGSHTLEEFQRWSSYLINAQTLHLGHLKPEEARQLIERPSPDFALRYEPEACDRVLTLTQGHPFLVQLLCAEVVVFKNEQDPSVRRLASLADVEAAVPEAIDSGSMFFSDIKGNQLTPVANQVLKGIAAQGEGAVVSPAAIAQQWPGVDVTAAIALLQRRELIEALDSGYKIRVELIRRAVCSN